VRVRGRASENLEQQLGLLALCQAQVKDVLPGGLRSLILRELVARAWQEVFVCRAVYVGDSTIRCHHIEDHSDDDQVCASNSRRAVCCMRCCMLLCALLYVALCCSMLQCVVVCCCVL